VDQETVQQRSLLDVLYFQTILMHISGFLPEHYIKHVTRTQNSMKCFAADFD